MINPTTSRKRPRSFDLDPDPFDPSFYPSPPRSFLSAPPKKPHKRPRPVSTDSPLTGLPSPVPPSTPFRTPPQSLQLTEANLAKLDSESTMTTPSKKTISTTQASKSSANIAMIWTDLRLNRFHYNTLRGQEVGTDIIREGTEIINGFRNSTMGKEEQMIISRRLKTYATANELTFVIHLSEVLLKDEREVRIVPGQETDANQVDLIKYVTTLWEKDGLRSNWQDQFKASLVPQLNASDDPWLEGFPKIKTPYPDITYGYEPTLCSLSMEEVVKKLQLDLCTDLIFPWFIVEAKSALEPIEQAEPQCARGGATIVNQLKILHAAFATQRSKDTAVPSSPGPVYPHVNPTAVAYAMAVAPSKAHIFVHFAEEQSAKVTHWHMELIGSYDFMKLEDYTLLRKAINNILDWGLIVRKPAMEDQCKAYCDSVRLGKKRKADTAVATQSVDASKEKQTDEQIYA
ncbi:MAG: hypothetical protein Q9163_001165 [Psora crenata]